jgi:hypothetical protein
MPTPEPVGFVELTLCGAVRRISGGPFDAFAPPAIAIAEPIAWVRAHYHPEAVETPAQAEAVLRAV